MKAIDMLSPTGGLTERSALPSVRWDMEWTEVLPQLLDSPSHELQVEDNEGRNGVITESSLLEAIARTVAARDDSSVIVVECQAGAYSASEIARAVEDADIHLVDLNVMPAEEGRLRITLRVRTLDPTHVISSLRRYGYEVIESSESRSDEAMLLAERMLALKTLFNI